MGASWPVADVTATKINGMDWKRKSVGFVLARIYRRQFLPVVRHPMAFPVDAFPCCCPAAVTNKMERKRHSISFSSTGPVNCINSQRPDPFFLFSSFLSSHIIIIIILQHSAAFVGGSLAGWPSPFAGF